MSTPMDIWPQVTLTPGSGVPAHPVIRPWSPKAEVMPAGPGRVEWRVFDDSPAASFNVRTGTAYAAGHVAYPVADASAAVPAGTAAWAAAHEALRQVRQLLGQRDRAEARRLARASVSVTEIAQRLHASEEQAAIWTAGR